MEEGKVKLDAEVEAGLEGKEEEMEKSGMQVGRQASSGLVCKHPATRLRAELKMPLP